MKRRITISLLLFLMAVLLLSTSCDIFKTPVSNENPDDNPLDPDNPNYEAPLAAIVEGPEDGSTITTDVATFRWSGNNDDCQFSYRLNNESWSSWSLNTSVTLDYLDEVSHLFQVIAKYPTDSVQHIPSEGSFTVDAIEGPALWLCHKKVETTVNDLFSVKVMLDDVTDLAMMSIVLNFDPTYLQIQEHEILKNGVLLIGKDLIQVDQIDNNEGQLTVYLALVSEAQEAINGSGPVINVAFETQSRGSSEIRFDEKCYLREYDNAEISINTRSGSQVRIE
ncbi:cohesin domain-containing protein [bacterium]|nr:cohesin domain-containing protein [bacterium]MBU1634592.1 cohesin domain-containing protein [bacterium]MBU1875019.1 cohesin domain-containing protein [bacterium]